LDDVAHCGIDAESHQADEKRQCKREKDQDVAALAPPGTCLFDHVDGLQEIVQK
jgi:hypothetical protein